MCHRLLLAALTTLALNAQSIGLFAGHSDIGVVSRPGAAALEGGVYTVSGGGENMWAAADSFHYVWKKVSGDVAIEADIAFPTKTGNNHKKAVLMIRESLDTDAPYVDAAVHLDGLTSLQSRAEKGGRTNEVGLNGASPKRVRLEKRGDYFYMFLAKDGEELHLAGGSMRLPLRGDFYIGLGVCAHDKDALETATFRNVKLAEPKLFSTLETVTISSTDRRVVTVLPGKIEAPNWTLNGDLIYNGNGKLHRIAATGGMPQTIDTGFAAKINNDHGLSPDGKWIAISDSTKAGRSAVYILPATGGAPRPVTTKVPSYWHGWSPDGKTVAYCGERGGKFDIYTISVDGGEETRLTQGEGHNDGPEYSPDGQWIYFNSSRTGLMQIWRMHIDGSGLEQVTTTDANNWFPHISPDGKTMAFLAYDKAVTGHPANQDVTLYAMSLADRQTKVVARLFGGQGTINVPSWSPDSKRIAFVSYQLLPQ